MNWDNFTFIDLFAGIGGIRLGFESVGGKCIFSSEFDEDACKTYEANFGEHPAGDITKIDAKSIPDFDILLGGFPCQAFFRFVSVLFSEWLIACYNKPKCATSRSNRQWQFISSMQQRTVSPSRCTKLQIYIFLGIVYSE